MSDISANATSGIRMSTVEEAIAELQMGRCILVVDRSRP